MILGLTKKQANLGLLVLFITIGLLALYISFIPSLLKDNGQDIGHVKGTILLGPTCPVEKDPPDPKCADTPIVGEFIVQNAMGNVEFMRFSTQRDGSFSISLPAGEYAITWAKPEGPGTQGHLINVLAGVISEYTIVFDSGIR